MTTSHEMREFNSPMRSIPDRKNTKRNKVSSPLDQSPSTHQPRKGDVFELFTVKAPSKPRTRSDSQDTSELSDDVFVKAKPVSVSSPSKSETKSYRDKINDRFRSVKEKAGKSTRKAGVFKEAAEKILLEKVKRESSDIDAELESMRNRLKLGKTPENREQYEFFCSEKCQEVMEEANNENFESTDDLSDDKVDVVFALPAQMRATLKSSEEALLFKPKAETVDTADKIDTEEPRFLEEEGFYVPPNPKVPTQHIQILEQRLSRDDKKWFNCDGKLNIVENPCQKNSYRPHLKHLPVSEIATYRPATVDDSECEEIVVVKENLLQLQISSVKFTHHPLFSLEHVLVEKLKKLFQEYEGSVARKEFLRLTGRLEGLRQVLRRLDEVSSQSGDHSDKEETKADAYRRGIKTLQEQVFEEGKKERDRIKAILQTWKAIKKTRETNGHSNTSVRLVIKKDKTDYEAEKESFEQAFEDTYEEYLSYNREKPRRKRQDEDDIREELLERFKESFRAPGEPILQFALTDEHEVTRNVENSKESNRRNVVSSTRITLKIVCNKMEVCKTKSTSLRDDFICHFDETVSIQPINVPKSITIEIIEQPKSLIRRTIGELTIKIPPRNVSKDDWKGAKFEKAEIVHYKHEGVGSGIKAEEVVRGLGVESGDDEELNTRGVLKYSLAWDAPVLGEEGSPEYGRRIVEGIIDKNGVVDAEKLSEWMQQHKPDPQDPRNAILYEYSAYVTNSLDCGEDATFASAKKNYFRLNQHLERWKFCDQKIIEDNLRLKVLQLRNKNEPEFDRMTVPNRIKEIPRDILADYERRVASERENLTVEEEDDDEDEIEKKRSRGRKLLKQIHIRVFQKCKNSQNNLTFEDVVDEKFLPQLEKLIKSTVTGFVSWFRWRPLKPLPQLRTLRDSKLEDYELRNQARVVVTVISGLNIPVRLSNKSEEVAAFVEAEYNGFTARTATSQGPHPTWNEMLTLPLEPTHLDYLNPNSLNGTITLNIFDEGDTVLSKFSGMKSRDWLGCVQIPLSAVCFNGIQGMFKVKIPQLLLGYKGKNLETNKSARSGSQSSQQTYLNLHVIMEPNVPKLNPSVEELPCAEVPYIKEHALRWNEDYNLNFPNRKFSVFAIDVNATTSCIVRYVKPLEPPQINVEGFDVTPEQCARFVSLIPFTNCNQFYKNIWLPVDRFLHFMIGSVVDHAVALTCYLLALKLEAWLLLGFGLPHGSSAFVLVKEYDNNQVANYYVYDVVLGEKINLTDAFCPLQKVYCVVNEHNVWANVQRNDDVATIRLDLTRRSDWLPLFNNQISAPTNSIHGKLTYLPQSATDELEIIIDRKIRKKIAKLRQLDRTVWNHNVSNVFKSILGSFEKSEMYGKSNSEAMEKIADCTATFKMRGLIFNSPFTDVSSMVKTVKSFSLHLEEEDNTQFASAVYLRSYPNHVLTTWVFVAAIKIKNASS